jgi:molybdopterin-guanine dinucleotide biosynthesis protein A
MLTYPGDAPFPHPGLVARLAEAAARTGLAVPLAGGYRQALVLLSRRDRAAELAGFYARGGRALRAWLDDVDVALVEMDDVADSFLNVNTPDDLARAEQRLPRPR